MNTAEKVTRWAFFLLGSVQFSLPNCHNLYLPLNYDIPRQHGDDPFNRLCLKQGSSVPKDQDILLYL